jgi:hypothetical protein
MEFIHANTKMLPTLEQIKETYKKHRDEWNNSEHYKTGMSRLEMYRTSVNEKSKKVGLLDMIEMFGITTKRPSTYTSAGIEIEVKKKVYAFEVLNNEGEPDRDFNRRNISRRFYVRYQPDDMSIVGLYEKNANGELRFIELAQTYLYVHRAKQDQTSWDLHIIRQTEHKNKEERIEMAKERNSLLEKHGLHPNQHGLNVAPLKGITSKTKKKDIGEIQKEISNITEIENTVKQQHKEKRAQDKQAAKKQEEKEQQQREFTRRRIEMMELTLNKN